MNHISDLNDFMFLIWFKIKKKLPMKKWITYSLTLLFLSSWTLTNAQNAGKAGKIWYSNDQLFVNIVNKGVLVVDNKNPKSPKKLGFIEIPGNIDIAVKGDILFANNHDDLIAINISKLAKISNKKIVKRFDGIFTQYKDSKGDEKIKWVKPSKKRWMASPTSVIASGSKGGSMACFSLVNDHLYALTPSAIHTFDVDKPKRMKKSGKPTDIFGDNFETIFSNGENLFVGGQGGMYIFDLDDPASPKAIGEYHHMQSCDPVVVEGDFAYVTLRNGNVCGRSKEINRLEVIDISNPSSPKLRFSNKQLSHPHGLAVDKGIVFVCDGNFGLKVLDATNSGNVKLMKTYDDIPNNYDIINIPEKKLLILVGQTDVVQYDYSSPRNLKRLSMFKTK